MNSKHLALPSIGLSGSSNPLIKMPFQKFETHISINFRTFAAGTKTTHTMHGKVQFCLDANGLPVACTSVEEDSGLTPGAPNKESTSLDACEIFRTCLMGHSEMRAGALKAQVMMRYGIRNDSLYGGLLVSALHQGYLIRRAVSDREVYYLPGPKMNEPTLNFDG